MAFAHWYVQDKLENVLMLWKSLPLIYIKFFSVWQISLSKRTYLQYTILAIDS